MTHLRSVGTALRVVVIASTAWACSRHDSNADPVLMSSSAGALQSDSPTPQIMDAGIIDLDIGPPDGSPTRPDASMLVQSRPLDFVVARSSK